MTIKIITDSTAYIPNHILQEFDIKVVSLNVIFNDEIYKENEISNDFFYNKLTNSVSLPTSSQPAIEELYNQFLHNAESGHVSVGIFISSEMSGTYATAKIAKNMVLENFPDAQIEIIDSRSNCMQLGYAVIAAAQAALAGSTLSEVVQVTKNNIASSKFIFIPDTLEYLKKGGRIGTASALLGSLMQIKPILTVNDGKTDVLGKIRTKKRAVKKLVNIFCEDIEKYGFGNATIHHINCEGEAQELAQKMESIVDKPVLIAPIGAVIGTHVGPGAIGIAYYTEEKLRAVVEQ